MRLWLVRHAQPQIAPGTCYGALDVDADAQATQAAAQALAQALPQGTAVRGSPLRRCAQLSQALRALRPDLPFTQDARLREMDFGDWEGLPWDAISPASLQAWTDDFAHHRPGGGESVHDFMARVAQVWQDTRAASADAVWITHAGVIRAAALLHDGRTPVTDASQWPTTACGYGQWQVIEQP